LLSLQLSSDTGIENVIGTPFSDILRGNSRDNFIRGGDSTLSPAPAFGPCSISYPNADQISGGGGNDTLWGEGGSDRIWGDSLIDLDPSQQGNDTIDGGDGYDCLYGQSLNDTLIVTPGDDYINGGSGDDQYSFIGATLGSPLIDVPDNMDTDTLDFLFFNAGPVCVNLSSPSHVASPCGGFNPTPPYDLVLRFAQTESLERVFGTGQNDHIVGNARDNSLFGGGGNDQLFGSGGNDTLAGGSGSDILRGQAGDDILLASQGEDVLWGDESAFIDPPEPVVWMNNVNLQVNGNNLTKISGGFGWNGGAISAQSVPIGDIYAETTIGETNLSRAFGLSMGDSGQHFNDIDFAIMLAQGGTATVYESGIAQGQPVAYAQGDVMRVEISNSQVIYSKNGSPFFVSSASISNGNYPIQVDTAFVHVGATLQNVIVGSNQNSGIDSCNGGNDQDEDTTNGSCETEINIP